jgi:hypothetical protein
MDAAICIGESVVGSRSIRHLRSMPQLFVPVDTFFLYVLDLGFLQGTGCGDINGELLPRPKVFYYSVPMF